MRRNTREFAPSRHHVRTKQEGSHLQARKRVPTGTKSAFILDISDSRNVRNKFLLFKPANLWKQVKHLLPEILVKIKLKFKPLAKSQILRNYQVFSLSLKKKEKKKNRKPRSKIFTTLFKAQGLRVPLILKKNKNQKLILRSQLRCYFSQEAYSVAPLAPPKVPFPVSSVFCTSSYHLIY